MKHKPLKPFLWFITLMVAVSMACSIGGSTPAPEPTQAPVQEATEAPPPTQAPKPTEEPKPTEPPAPTTNPLIINNLGDVQKAVIQIEAEGTFLDPEIGWNVNVGKRGSGVIIDPSGLAVTNNHVVTGGAILRVWIGGDTTKTYNARVLGVSECSDLAVIDIDGDGFPYVEWYEADLSVGTKVFAAGFPLGDPNYTLTDGIISKAPGQVETSWASVDSVVEHTAKINPGNSGGPLVTEDGKLVGINYAGVTETDQNYAISREEATVIIRELIAGKDVDSIGVNGGAVYGFIGDLTVSGVWVRSTASGSPADKAGILPGDIIYQLENEVLATDGTMADYCDVLRSRNPGDTMQLTVIRWTDLSLHEGQINGRELEFQGYFAEDSSGSSSGGGSAGGLNPNCDFSDTAGYIECLDDTFTILVEVPDYWTDYNGGQWTLDDEVIGVAISAAPSLSDFNDYWDAEGLFYGASDTFAKYGGYVQFLDIYTEDYRNGCSFDGRFDYNDGLYRGKYDAYFNCGGAGGYDAYVLSAVPVDNPSASIILLIIQVQKGDSTTVEHIWNTFIVGDL